MGDGGVSGSFLARCRKKTQHKTEQLVQESADLFDFYYFSPLHCYQAMTEKDNGDNQDLLIERISTRNTSSLSAPLPTSPSHKFVFFFLFFCQIQLFGS